MNGKSLGEGASIQELSEQILYYHFDPRWVVPANNNNNGNNVDNDSAGGGGGGGGGSSHGSETSTATTATTTTLTEEAVQFLGLCTALLTIPSSLGDDDLSSDYSKEIYFGSSTLVFVQLENNNNHRTEHKNDSELIAVAQIPRLYQNGAKVDSAAGGNPLAVRRSIERCHSLFCTLRGGGIITRLQQGRAIRDQKQKQSSSSLSTDSNDRQDEKLSACPYEGMDELFKLQKELRNVQNLQLRKSIRIDDDTEEGKEENNDKKRREKQILSLQRQIRAYRKTLPILSIRRDLDAHYKEYLCQMSIIGSRNGGANRCIVETIPTPIPQNTASHVIESTSTTYNAYVAVTLGIKIQQLLDSVSASAPASASSSSSYSSGSMSPSLIGISTFYKSRYIYSHLSPVLSVQTNDKNEEEIDTSPESYILSNEIPYSLMTYMAGYRTKMNHLAGSTSQNNNSSSSQSSRLGIQRLTLNAISDQGTNQPTSPTHLLNVANHDNNENNVSSSSPSSSTSGNFMPAPPDFMFAAYESSYHVKTRYQNKVWAPKIHLPLQKIKRKDSINNMNSNSNNTNDDDNSDEKKQQPSITSSPSQQQLQQQELQQRRYFVDGQVVLFEMKDFSFLIYLSKGHLENRQEKEEKDTDIFQSMLDNVQDTLAQAILLFYEQGYDKEPSGEDAACPDNSWIGPGQDIIIVRRNEQQLVLYSDRSRQIVENEGRKRANAASAAAGGGSTKSSSRRFWSFSSSKSTSSSRTNHNQTGGNSSSSNSTSRSPILEWSALGLDCRHLLSSHLHLDIILA